MDNARSDQPGKAQTGRDGDAGPTDRRRNLVAHGRPRKFDPTVPAHIRQTDLPAGLYWNRRDGNWYTILQQGDRPKRVWLGDKNASLPELHAALESARGVDRQSLDWLMDLFEQSPVFSNLEESTKKHYRKYRGITSLLPTRSGALGRLPAQRLSTPLFQGIVDRLESEGTPTKANHLLRYVRRVYTWGVQRGHVLNNPCKGVAQAKERKRRRLPQDQVFEKIIALAKERATRPAHSKGSLAPHLWMITELMYLCRLRRVEAITLTDANALDAGVLTNRRKGSRDTIVAWTPRLRAVWNAAQERRRQIQERRHLPLPLNATDRVLLVAQDGAPLSEESASSRWRAMMDLAVSEGVISKDERFGMHDVKRKAITDSPGNRHDKQQQSGHRSERMMDIYDQEIPVVPTPEKESRPG